MPPAGRSSGVKLMTSPCPRYWRFPTKSRQRSSRHCTVVSRVHSWSGAGASRRWRRTNACCAASSICAAMVRTTTSAPSSCFSRRSTLDPDYALAHAYRAFRRRRQCMAMAMRLTEVLTGRRCHWPRRPLRWTAMTVAVIGFWQFQGIAVISGGRAAHYRRAIALNPNDANAIAGSVAARLLGRPRKASIASARRCASTPIIRNGTGSTLVAVLYMARRYADAVEAYGRAHGQDIGSMSPPRRLLCANGSDGGGRRRGSRDASA